jgi:hypothetical protein
VADGERDGTTLWKVERIAPAALLNGRCTHPEPEIDFDHLLENI